MPDSLLVNLADREGDIYEWFAEYQDYAPAVRAEWIVRATQNRRLLAASEETAKCLWDALQQAPVLGHTEVNVKPRPNRAARAGAYHATRCHGDPQSAGAFWLSTAGIERQRGTGARRDAASRQGTFGMALTDQLAGGEFRASGHGGGVVCRALVYRSLLPCIEERLHLETEERLLPCLALYMVIAWRVLFSLMLARATPDMDCEIVFDPQEWRAAYIVVKRSPPPLTPPRLGEVILLVASLGGYFARKHDGPPGAKAMWIGLQRLHDFVIALEAQQDVSIRCV